jgi:aspartyl/asparaginyl-tRNA synthetase
MNSTADRAEFEIEGTVERVNGSAKVTFLRVKVGGSFAKVFDVVTFRRPANDIDRGSRIRVTGDLSKKKSALEERGRDGKMYPVHQLELIARSIELLEPGQGHIPGTEPRNDNAATGADDVDDHGRRYGGDKIPF